MKLKHVVALFLVVDLALLASALVFPRVFPESAAKVAEEIRYARNLQEAMRLERQVHNRARFVAPADGRLTAKDVAVVFAVWHAVAPEVAREKSELYRRYRQALRTDAKLTNAQDQQARAEERRRALAIDLRAMPAQVPVLNAYGMSLAEYRWAKNIVFESVMQIEKEDNATYLIQSKATIVGPPGATAKVIAEGRPASGTLGANVARVRTHGDFDPAMTERANVGF